MVYMQQNTPRIVKNTRLAVSRTLLRRRLIARVWCVVLTVFYAVVGAITLYAFFH